MTVIVRITNESAIVLLKSTLAQIIIAGSYRNKRYKGDRYVQKLILLELAPIQGKNITNQINKTTVAALCPEFVFDFRLQL